MQAKQNKRGQGFSLIELVIVVVIIGIIGAIAIPRLSRGAAGAADSALIADLAVLRNAIDLYSTEHGGKFPSGTDITNQLTQYTDLDGAFAAAKDATKIYGPYLRKVPALKVGANKGNSGIATADGPGVGWLYNSGTGTIAANSSDLDATNKAYSTY